MEVSWIARAGYGDNDNGDQDGLCGQGTLRFGRDKKEGLESLF
jgi:hypothetical protein